MPGRNDPCPCGSGKKYKKCCYKKDQVDKRVAERRREVDVVLEPDASIYKVWLEWRAARRLADFNFLFDLVRDDSPLKQRLGDRERFVAACSDGAAAIPTGEAAEFRHLRVVDGSSAQLLQTVGLKDPAAHKVRCECITLRRGERGWRLDDFEVVSAEKGEEPDLSLFEAGSQGE